MNTSMSLVAGFKSYFKQLHGADLSRLGDFYDTNVVFKDPVHEVHGLIQLEDYFASLCADLSECRFEYLSELLSDDAAYIKWVMHFRHPRLGNRLISVCGVSHFLISGDKIQYQEDFYDMGALLYEQVPVFGALTRWLKGRLAG